MSPEDDELYPCVGVCMVDEDSGLCMGCGKPVQEPAGTPEGAPHPHAGTADGAP
jgi:hypothetical protein